MRKYRTTKKAITEESAGAIPEQFTRQAVEKLAYEFWLNRGCPDGSAEEDWFQAEQALQTAQPDTDRSEVRTEAAGRVQQGAVMRAGG